MTEPSSPTSPLRNDPTYVAVERFCARLEGESDSGCIVAAGTALEDGLERLLKAVGDKPPAKFHHRIERGKALQLFDDFIIESFHSVRKIRNIAGHENRPAILRFSDSDIASLVFAIDVLTPRFKDVFALAPRYVFARVASCLFTACDRLTRIVTSSADLDVARATYFPCRSGDMHEILDHGANHIAKDVEIFLEESYGPHRADKLAVLSKEHDLVNVYRAPLQKREAEELTAIRARLRPR